MKPLESKDLLPHVEYERQRESFRRGIIDLKRRRRITVGEFVTLVFENRETIQFQIQEMIRVEHIIEPAKIQDELDVYNAMLPKDGELSATLMIEIAEDDRLKELLDTFKGIDRGRTVALKVGSRSVYAEFESGHSNEEKISAVHFVKFRPDAAFVEALSTGEGPLIVSLDHGPFRAEAAASEEMRQEWLFDLHTERLSRVTS